MAGSRDGQPKSQPTLAQPTIAPGDRIDGGYVVEGLLGQGGMGSVFVARQEKLARRVAVKVLHHATDPATLARFEREARIVAALRSDHVARVLDVGQLASGSPFIVMDLLEGEDLAQTLRRQGPLSVSEVTEAVVQACDALGEAHALGVVHRDIKPANLFRVRRSNGEFSVKVLDFGISKSAGPISGDNLTRSSLLVGSPSYMSPEQLREARTVDVRSDIWSLGVTMFELLTGQRPYHGDNLADLTVQVLTGEPRRLRTLVPDLPIAFEAVVTRCMARDPERRYATTADLVRELRSGPRALAEAGTQDRASMALATTQAAVPKASAAPSSRSGAGINSRITPSGARSIARSGRVLERARNHAVGVIGDVVVVYGFRGSEGDPSHVVAARNAVVRENERTRKPVRLLFVLPDASRTPPPSTEVRSLVMAEVKAHQHRVSKIAVALLGEGFGAATQRAVVSGIIAVLRSQRAAVAADVTTALAKLLDPAEDAQPIREFCERELAVREAT